MQSPFWQRRAARAAIIPGIFALGAVSMISLRGIPVQSQATAPPVQPPAQAVEIQNAFEKVAEKLRPSVVFIKSRQSLGVQARQNPMDEDEMPFRLFPNIPGGPQFRMGPPRRAEASGSGVIVRSDGYILTNDHVVQGADKVTVRLLDGREFPGTVKRDFRSDLALVKIEATGLPAAELGDSDKVKIGHWAIAFGSPFGNIDTMTVGIVSGLNRAQNIGREGRRYTHLIQTDASINPGNSGGPLVDIYGRIIGINVAIESPSGANAGIGFAIPANTARFVMEQLITKGTVTRGYLGVGPKTLEFDEKQRYGVQQGALIATMEDNTPASKAGLQVGDVIVKINGKAVADEGALRDMIARSKPGDTVRITVIRDGKERAFTATLTEAPSLETAQRDESSPAGGRTQQRRIGVVVTDATNAEARKQFNIKGDPQQGVIVTEVAPGSPAASAGVQPGDILLRLNGISITNAERLGEIARNLKEGQSVPAVIRRGGSTSLVQIELE